MEDYEHRLHDIWGPNPSDARSALSWIQACVQRNEEENLYLDFKQKKNAKEWKPDQDDRENLARAISGFANTAGGLVIWGVKAKAENKGVPDVANELAPISHLKEFVAELNHLSGSLVEPPVPGVNSRPVPMSDDSDRGFAVTIVPRKRDALVKANAKRYRDYFIRTGSGFHSLPSSMIAEFYSRRPAPLFRLSVAMNSAKTREKLLTAEFRKTVGRRARELAWGKCTYEQELILTWLAVLRNEGDATARDIKFQLQLTPDLPGSWSISDVAFKATRVGEQYPGHTPSAVTRTVQRFEKVAEAGQASGCLPESLHPGQKVIIAKGELVFPSTAASQIAAEILVEMSGSVFAEDAAPKRVHEVLDPQEIRLFLEKAAATLKPATRMIPEPSDPKEPPETEDFM